MTQKNHIKLNYLALAALIVLPIFSLLYSHGLALAGTHAQDSSPASRIANIQAKHNAL
jgi:hypothetical protein